MNGDEITGLKWEIKHCVTVAISTICASRKTDHNASLMYRSIFLRANHMYTYVPSRFELNIST